MKLALGLIAVAWLIAGCASTVPNDDSPGSETKDARTGLCNDATPPPCNPPKD
jgi:hypothetical protein